MVICPIALAVHCTGCPLVKVCPLKTTLGDYGKTETELPSQTTKPAQREESPGPPDTSADPTK